jgi:hypothetical protein
VSLEALTASKRPLDAKTSKQLDKRTEGQLSFAVTPSKKARVAFEATADIESPLLPMLRDLGPPEVVLNALGPAWLSITENVKTADRIARAARSSTEALEDEVEQGLEEVDVKLSSLFALLGERPAALGTQGAFSVIVGVLEDIEAMKGTDVAIMQSIAEVRARLVNGLEGLLKQQVSEQIRSQVFSGAFYKNFVAPTALLLRRCSPNAEKPGELWANRMSALEEDVKRLVRNAAGSSAATYQDEDMGGWEGGRWDMDVDPAPSRNRAGDRSNQMDEQIQDLRQSLEAAQREIAKLQQNKHLQGPSSNSPPSADDPRLNAIERELMELRGQMRMTGITFGEFTFDSPSEILAWMTKHGVLHKAHLFTDPLSLMSLSDTVADDEETATKSRLDTQRVNDKCVEATRYRASFYLEIPPILGKRGDPATTTNERTLAAVPKYADWDTGKGRDGVSNRLSDLVNEGERTLTYTIQGELTGDPQRLATKMLAQSLLAWEKLSAWMTKYYNEVGARSQSLPQECWILVTHCVRKVLSEARSARSPGKSGKPQDMLWATLHAHAFFQALLDHKIQGHPKISVILQQHLIDHATPMSSFLVLEKIVHDLQRVSKQGTIAADRNASKTKGPPKNG